MSAIRLIVFALLGAAGVVWSAAALYAHTVRLQHRELITDLRSGEKQPTLPILSKAITDYESALSLLPCRMTLHEDLGLLLAYQTDIALAQQDVEIPSKALDQMHEELAAILACTPTDGKAWLDLAMVNTYREGFTTRSLDAYKASAKVTPGESWLAEKRMLFALQFRPLFDDAARNVVESDLKTLERAHPNRMQKVMETAQVTSPAALRALFATTTN